MPLYDQPMPRILVLYLSIGSGHQVAAEAITAALRRANAEAICTDPIAERSRVWISLMNLGNSLSGLATRGWTGQAS